MSGFRRFGGKNFSATNNITRSFISTSDQMNISNYSGQENTREQFNHIIKENGFLDADGSIVIKFKTIFKAKQTKT